MASSLTRIPGPVSNSSTASRPTTSSSVASRMARRWISTARSGSRPGAGASTSTQIPSRCTVSTTGYVATCPNGERATSAASSRRSGTRSSTISSVRGSGSSGPTTQTPLPSYPPRTALTTTGQPCAAAKALTSVPHRGTGIPSSPSRSRMARLSWAYRSAAAPGATATPSAVSASMCPGGTCSWSNVTTSQPLAKACSTPRSVWSPICTSAATSPAPSSGTAARIRNDWPREIAA
jgi:hypothetical protein